jgi:hypothetical protein
MDNQKILATIATIFGLLPIFFGLLIYKRAKLHYKYFILFLIYGFLTDALVGILFNFNYSVSISKILFALYPLVESVFLFWFFRCEISNSVIKKLATFSTIIIIPYYLITLLIAGTHLDLLYFNTVYNILVACFSGYVLIKSAEKHYNVTNEPIVWISLGIGLYSFGTFFIYSIFDLEVRKKIWFIHNLVSILTCLFISVGFIILMKKLKREGRMKGINFGGREENDCVLK